MSTDICLVDFVDEKRVGIAREGMSPEGTLRDLADTFKVLGDFTRMRILQALSLSELCVCDLSALLESTSSAVSHQLRLLRAAKLVRCRKEGKMVYYSLNDENIRSLLAEGLRHVEEGPVPR